MAKARIKNSVEKVERVIIEEKCVRTIQLELSENEAIALQLVLRRVGGHPDESRRGDIQEILNNLNRLMVVRVNKEGKVFDNVPAAPYFQSNDEYSVIVEWKA